MLRGLVASKTNKKVVEGIVYLSDYLTLSYVQEMNNKILVCIQTDFANMNILGKFKAIITNHGGILSHAAIYSREFKIPCIVGAKNATKVLKNGDCIRLNLETGDIEVVTI